MKLLDVVAITEDLPEADLSKGQVGTIVEELDRETVLVEFADLEGVAYAIQAIPCAKLMELHHRPTPDPRSAVLARLRSSDRRLLDAARDPEVWVRADRDAR